MNGIPHLPPLVQLVPDFVLLLGYLWICREVTDGFRRNRILLLPLFLAFILFRFSSLFEGLRSGLMTG